MIQPGIEPGSLALDETTLLIRSSKRSPLITGSAVTKRAIITARFFIIDRKDRYVL